MRPPSIQNFPETVPDSVVGSKLKNDMLKIAQIKVAGRNVNVRKATVFIAALSICAARIFVEDSQLDDRLPCESVLEQFHLLFL